MNESIRSKDSQVVQKTWSDLRAGGDLIPVFSPIDHLAFADVIPFLAIADLDFDAKTMPVKLAGSAIREFIGFEITGQDFLKYDVSSDTEASWQHRRNYHDYPCGRYERMDIKFDSGKSVV